MDHVLFQQNARGQTSEITLSAIEARIYEQAWHDNRPVLGSSQIPTFIEIALDEGSSPAIRRSMIERLTLEVNSPSADKIQNALLNIEINDPNKWLRDAARDASEFFEVFLGKASDQSLIASSYFENAPKWEQRVVELVISNIPRRELTDELLKVCEILLERVDADGYLEWRGRLVDYIDTKLAAAA